MSFTLRNNFFINARGLSFADGGGVTWSFNANTNTVTATATGTGPSAANPSASIGLAVVDGSASTYMRSDGAPALSQAIAPTWTAQHNFTPGTSTTALVATAAATSWPARFVGNAGVTSFTGSSKLGLSIAGPSSTNDYCGIDFGTSAGNFIARIAAVGTTNGGELVFGTSNNFSSGITNVALTIDFNGKAAFSAAIGVNNATPPAQVAGWGTPTGASVEANFAAGSGQTMAVISAAVAKIITDLKAFGIYAA